MGKKEEARCILYSKTRTTAVQRTRQDRRQAGELRNEGRNGRARRETQGHRSQEAPFPFQREDACAHAALRRSPGVGAVPPRDRTWYAVLTRTGSRRRPAGPLAAAAKTAGRFSPQEQEVPCAITHKEGRGNPAAHFHWWLLSVGLALRPRRDCGGSPISGTGRKRRAGKPSLYGSLTCQGIGLDGIPEVIASEGFIVNEINKRVLEGHVFDVNCCRFFPSGLVVLSGGMDAQLKIWSAEDASCAATFKGHRGGILDTAIVDRGRNVVSGSRDGTARLWDCGRSACLGVIADCGSSINGVAVGAADNSINLGSPEQIPIYPRNMTVFASTAFVREQCQLLLPEVNQVFLFIGSDAFNCCTFLSGFLLLAGTQDGNIYQLDVRSPRAPVQVIHRSGAPVLSLLNFRDGFIASQGDGSCFIVQQDLDYAIELTGADCDPVYKAATWEKQIYTCCRDGLLRRYQLSDF
ncbi:Proteasomal ATPase-associated factor 1 [Fukomys damarensis]|uniref:Proteasomal ATPase-associated factor 1 n=1 Tax=Fukomys damarensis TaxID=885580 RepID=A0A091CZ56_FUKDA|nr:Proteasomal ATPase-associated factor 1 [Fukomys damarensis]